VRIVITLEDTTLGVSFGRQVSFSGVNDGIERSLAAHVSAFIEQHMAKLQRLHALRVTGMEDGNAHLPPPRR
jgi:hypothetical protein